MGFRVKIMGLRRSPHLWALVASAVLLAGTFTAYAAVSHSGMLLMDTSSGDNWPAFGRTYGEQHFSPLTQINDETIGRLKLAWYYDLPTGQPVRAGVQGAYRQSALGI